MKSTPALVSPRRFLSSSPVAGDRVGMDGM
jgi:hypothetical protein